MPIDRETETRLWNEARQVLQELLDLYGAFAAQFKAVAAFRGTAMDAEHWSRWFALRGDLAALYHSAAVAIARNVGRGLPRLAVTATDDLVSMATVGLLEALDAFDVTGPVRFTSFCTLRIHGAIMDELRRLDYIPRRRRELAKTTGEEFPQFLYGDVPEATDEEPSDELPSRLQANPDALLRHFPSRLKPCARLLLLERRTDAGIAVELGVSAPTAKKLRSEVVDRLTQLAPV